MPRRRTAYEVVQRGRDDAVGVDNEDDAREAELPHSRLVHDRDRPSVRHQRFERRVRPDALALLRREPGVEHDDR